MTFPSVMRRGLPTLPWRWTLLAFLTACATGELTNPPDNTEVLTHPSIGSEVLVLPDTIVTGINRPVLLTRFAPAPMDSSRTTIVWSASGGEITSSGLFTSATAGSYRIKRWRPRRGRSDTTVVVVTPAELERVSITPDSIHLAGLKEATFTAKGHFSDGTSGVVAAAWSATGGTIDAAGMYRAGGSPGRYRVIGTSNEGPADTSVVIVGSDSTPPPEEPPPPPEEPPPPPAPTLASVTLTPSSTSVQTGATYQFQVKGTMSDGTPSRLTPAFTATGGSISSSGSYRAGQTAGNYRVIASMGGLADTAAVTITAPPPPPPPTLASVTLTPSGISVQTGATYQFQAKGTMSDGTPSQLTAVFTATGGSISSNGSYLAGQTAGNYRVIASMGGLADTAAVTITAPPPPPPPSGTACLRTINVATSSQLAAALSAARPGDCIELAAGSYSAQSIVGRKGTAADSITLRGPANAILSGALRLQDIEYWRFIGFAVRGGVWCIEGQDIRHNVFRGLDIAQCGQEGIVLHHRSSRNLVEGNWIHDIGKTAPQYGEAVYIGSGGGTLANVDPSDSNRVVNNRLGPGVTAEHIDVKRGTRGNIIEGNDSDARGHLYDSPITTTLYMNGGVNTVIRGNTIINFIQGTTSGSTPFQAYQSVSGLWAANSVSGQFRKAFDLNGTNHMVKCDNQVSGGPWGVTCQ